MVELRLWASAVHVIEWYTRSELEPDDTLPGSAVSHGTDHCSYGIVVGSRSDGRVGVVWSKRPWIETMEITNMTITANVRPLECTWTVGELVIDLSSKTSE